MTEDIKWFGQKYPHIIDYRSIGQSHLGREIWAVKLGNGIPNIFINGSHHGREWISTNIVMYMLDRYAAAYIEHRSIDGYDVKDILNKVSIWFVPMVNPDGVTLQQFGLDPFPKEMHQDLISMNNGSRDFQRWKANLAGVDPNRQYPYNWENTRDCPGRRSFANYRGTAPLTEPENIALVEFTYEILPEIAVSYHSSGRVIFYPENSPRLDIAANLARLTGYRRIPLAHTAAGYTDWFVDVFNKPAYTPELCYLVGPTNPPLSVFNEEWERNRLVGLYLAEEAYESWITRIGASPTVPVFYNELQMYFPDQKPLLHEGRTYVPARAFADNLHIRIEWEAGKLYLARGTELIRKNYFILNNRAMVPLTALTSAAELDVSFHKGMVWVRKEEDEFDFSPQ